jgi:hypothetical protein
MASTLSHPRPASFSSFCILFHPSGFFRDEFRSISIDLYHKIRRRLSAGFYALKER